MANIRNVGIIAREAYLNRNAAGAPKHHRAAMKAVVRPLLRQALKSAHLGREALRAGDNSIAGHLLLLARLGLAQAQLAGVISVAGSRAQVWATNAASRGKLSADDRRKALAMLDKGLPQKTVAAQFGVSEKTIQRLRRSHQ